MHLAAVGDRAAPRHPRNVALWGWIGITTKGRGIGLTPDLTGPPADRWIKPCAFVLRGTCSRTQSDVFLPFAGEQAILVAPFWPRCRTRPARGFGR